MTTPDPRVEAVFRHLIGTAPPAPAGEPTTAAALVGEEVWAIMRRNGASEQDVARWFAAQECRRLAPGADLTPLCHRLAAQALIGTFGLDGFEPDMARALADELLAVSRGEPPPPAPVLRRGGRAPGRNLPPPRR